MANPAAPYDRALDLFHEATEYRGLNSTSLPKHAKVLLDRVEEGRLDFGQMFEPGFIETIRTDSERAAMWSSVPDRVWEYERVVPVTLQIVDETVLVWLGRTREEPAGLLGSQNPAVLSWGESLYAEYQTEAEPLTAL